MSKEDIKKSIEDYIKNTVDVDIFNSDFYFNMGKIYENEGEYNRAYLCYEHSSILTNEEEKRKERSNSIHKLEDNFNVEVNKYSIVILTYNNLDFTKMCIESIKKYNEKDNYEIIIIDNNSTDGTVEWIKSQEGLKYILNNENKGFPIGCNQGINLASKDNDIFLLNNDTVIMPNSIFNLRMGLYSCEKVGATSAVSNSISYYQQISKTYTTLDEYKKFALKNNITNENSYEERIKLVGFAMLIKRNVLDKVGLLDETFTPGNFEDDDLSLRIIMAGYKLILCKDSYIHHFGGVSFKKDLNNYSKLLSKNANVFKEKWGFSSEYSMNIRHDMLSFFNEDRDSNINVLEVGCACGATLLEIKNRYPNSNIYGIELNENSANIAKCFADIRAENIENNELSYEKHFFDYIIFADVLEHLYNPKKVLEVMKQYLKKDGYLLASIPNVMHYSVVKALINGNWTYEDAGILDKTHLRFFTKSEIIKMLNEAGYDDLVMRATFIYISDEDNKFIENISKLSAVDVREEFKYYQYLVRAKNVKKLSEEIIRDCTFIIRRLEFHIDVKQNLAQLISYLEKDIIDENNILDIVINEIINKVHVLNLIGMNCFDNKLQDVAIFILNNAYKLSPEDLNTNYNLAFVLNSIGEKEAAIQCLEKLENTKHKIDELRKEILEHGGSN